ncbi:MAG: glutamine synthetase [Clostridia bacterium]|nr:glutamine synthetase [Clostridia bacterium]
MKYTKDEVMQYIAEEDVKFIRLAFCDVFGRQKNISIMQSELDRAFRYGIAIDASAVEGFGGEVHSDLVLHPDPSTISVLPWRPGRGKVVRMFCSVSYPDGSQFECDTRNILKNAVEAAEKEGLSFFFGAEMEFYIFKRDENGEPTRIPYDNAGYMDIAPEDKGENVRREICLTLEQMGIYPESSHHEEGPGQNEIDFRYSEPVSAADNAVTFKSVVQTIATLNGLYADFTPKPISGESGNGMHINFSVHRKNGEDVMSKVIAGIMAHIPEMTVFLNNSEDSYKRFGSKKAPKFISWSAENRSQLIRIPAAENEYRRAELRSPDPMCNPYLAFALLIYAGIEGVKNDMKLPDPADVNLYTAPLDIVSAYDELPDTFERAKHSSENSEFIRGILPKTLLDKYFDR